MRMAYPFLPIFPRIRGIVLLDEERNIFYASPKRKTMQKLMPGLLHAASGISGIINEEVQEITTGKLRIHIVKEEEPFNFFTVVVVNKEASEQVGMWAVYISKFVSTLLIESKINNLTDESKEIIHKNLAEKIETIKVPKRENVLNFTVQVFDSIKNKEEILKDSEILKLKKSIKEEKYKKTLSKEVCTTEPSSLEKIYRCIDQGRIYKAFLLSEKNREKEKFALIWLALGLILKNSYYEIPVPSMTELEKIVKTLESERYSSFLKLVEYAVKLKKSAKNGVKTYRFLKEKIGNILSSFIPLSNKFNRYLLLLILHSLTNVFLPVEQKVLNLLSKYPLMQNNSPFCLFWQNSGEKSKISRSILPVLLVRTFTWKKFQPFSYILSRLKKPSRKEKERLNNKSATEKKFSWKKAYLNAIRSFTSFFILGVFYTPSLEVSDKEKFLDIFKKELDSVLKKKEENFAFAIPLAHIGKAAINLNQLFLQRNNNRDSSKFYLHGKKAIREILKLRKKQRLGELVSSILLLIGLDTLNLDIFMEDNEVSPELLTALNQVITKDAETIHMLERITSPYYLRRILLTTGLKILAKREANNHQKLRSRGLKMLGNFIPRMMTRGEFSWDILANLWRFEKGKLPPNRKDSTSLKALKAVLTEEAWKVYGWQSWTSKVLLQFLEDLKLKQSIF